MPDPIHNWLAVRTAYIVKRWSAKKCATEFKINVTTIKKMASKEGWTAERDRMLANAEAVVGDELREAAADQAAALDEAVLDAINDKRKTDAEFATWLAKIIQESEIDLAGIKDPAERIMARNRIAAMTSRYLSARRLVLGITPGQPSDTSNEFGSGEPIAPAAPDGTEIAAGTVRRFVVKIHEPKAIEPPALSSVG